MKVGDKVRRLASHSSYTDQELAAGRYVGVIKNIFALRASQNLDPDPVIQTRCVEVSWPNTDPPGISWHFPYRLVVIGEDEE